MEFAIIKDIGKYTKEYLRKKLTPEEQERAKQTIAESERQCLNYLNENQINLFDFAAEVFCELHNKTNINMILKDNRKLYILIKFTGQLFERWIPEDKSVYEEYPEFLDVSDFWHLKQYRRDFCSEEEILFMHYISIMKSERAKTAVINSFLRTDFSEVEKIETLEEIAYEESVGVFEESFVTPSEEKINSSIQRTEMLQVHLEKTYGKNV